MPQNAPLPGHVATSEPEGYAKSRETRARILEAALAEASEAGFHKTSVARIAARAGVAVGSLHYHFGSRGELLRELMAALMADLMARLHSVDSDEDKDFFARQRAGLLAYLDSLRATPALARLADEIKLHEPELHRQGLAEWVERMEARIRAGIAEGSLREMDAEEVTAQAHLLLGSRHFLEQMLEGSDGQGDEAVVDAYVGLVRNGLGSAMSASKSELPFDPDALREKYRAEREKRLRPDGIGQYQAIEGDFAHFESDPYVAPGFQREPLRDEVDVVVIGGGFGGLLTGARLRQQGVEDVRIIEKGGDFGGTWYWNRYPGLACDIESYVYLPLLEELGYVPVEKYSRGPEIFAHCKAIAEKYDLYRNACLQTQVTEIRWDEAASRWIVRTDRDDAMRARFVCLSNGFLQKPKLPGIPGIETFTGHSFHTSRWDYAYTGGDENGKLNGLGDKRVGIIGTGATAVQCVPHLGASAGHLYVFQRTPSSIGVRANQPTDPDWARSLEPGWHRKRIDNFQILTAGGYQEEDLVNDGWTEVIRKVLTLMLASDDPDVSPEALAETVELADFMQMEQIRARVDALVEDPETAEALKPYYRQFCKRPCFHDDYLQTFNRPNVTLVDTAGKGVERITEKGVVVGGEEYALDCLIYATGFEVGTDYSHRAGFDIVGRKGRTLTEKWSGGIRTLHGMHIHGFPNCFMMSIAQSGFTVNFPYLLDLQATHIAHIAGQALERGIQALEVTEQAEAEWVDAVIGFGGRTEEFSENCTPGYYNNEGRADAKSRQGGFYFGEPTGFAELLEAWRADGSLKGLAAR